MRVASRIKPERVGQRKRIGEVDFFAVWLMDGGMISITESAARRIAALHDNENDPDKLLRIFVDAGGCSGLEYGMGFDQAKEGDQLLEDGGVSFLIDETSLAHLNGSVVHFDDGLHGKGFEITNPNAKTTCGCGRSFS